MLSSIIRKLLESLSFFYLNNMKQVEINDREIYNQIKKKIKSKYVKSKNLKTTHKIFNKQIFKLIRHRNLKNFLRYSFIQKMFFVHNRFFILKELNTLKQDKKWTMYKKVLTEDPAGNPIRYFLYPQSSGNQINHVYHLSILINSLNLDLRKVKHVYEFGGGYGCMARIFSKFNQKVNYTIFDTKLVNLLQYYYLKQNALDVGFNKNHRFLLINKFKFTNKRPLSNSLFIANWSMSETPVDFRKKIIFEMKNYENILISFQESFENINNLSYFKNLQSDLKSNYRFKLILNNFYKGNIIKKERHYFLIGKKLKV
tara:strand:+ start:5612 stop:6553 length:942 start_codon:yes stop_codon:yes gene_type:complete